VTGMGITFA